MVKYSRRDFLKSSIAITAAASMPRGVSGLLQPENHQAGHMPNVIIIVFDALSARNMSVYDYPRRTTPNFERFAQRAVVYHSHSSSGNYTTPGTASILTGMYPWSHRAINQSGQIQSDLVEQNIFKVYGNGYHRHAFGQNTWADIFLHQFNSDIEFHLLSRSFGAISPWLTGDMLNDANLSRQALDYFLFSKSDPPASLLFGSTERIYGFNQSQRLHAKDYPRGMPEMVAAPFYYRMDDLFSGLASYCSNLQSPYLFYIHVYPPHDPYKPTRAYFDLFKDAWIPPAKPAHRMVIIGRETDSRLNTRRRSYDQFIANLDFEFGRLLDSFETSGILENSYVILTSDHGEMFERGQHGHSTPLLYEPVIHIPLLISTPARQSREDIHSPTNNVDLLPTLLKIAGREQPEWCEGKPLPGLGGNEEPQRSTYSVEAKLNPSLEDLKIATVAMRKDNYKIIYYTGYESEDIFEMYDLQEDPEELNDLEKSGTTIAKLLREELLEKFHSVNVKYRETRK